MPPLLLCRRPAVPDADFAGALAKREQAGAGHRRGGEAGAVLAEGDRRDHIAGAAELQFTCWR